MSDDASPPTILTVTLDAHCAKALDAWIARSIDPSMDRNEAAGHVLSAALGHGTPSTTIPGLVTGRDIV